uniref:Putative secreted protein n=1 Tax=Anopheles darlingi TaxID=43151 RepID=A0A2M4D4N6_ANODA
MPMLVVALLWLGAVGTPLPVALRLLLDDPRMLMMPLSPPLPCASLVTVPSPEKTRSLVRMIALFRRTITHRCIIRNMVKFITTLCTSSGSS